MKKKVNETNVSTDVDTFNKIRGKLKPTDNVSLTDKKPNASATTPIGTTTSSSSSSSASMAASMAEDTVGSEPSTIVNNNGKIKYLSNVKDEKTGEVSKPFSIGDKHYQIVRGVTASDDVVMGVYCHDDKDEDGENIIHPMDHFEKNIAKPFHESMQGNKKLKETGHDFSANEREFADKEAFMDYLNLTDLVGYKHFFVNVKTGEIVAKFKNTKEMIKSGIKLGPDEDYMDVKGLKRFRFGDYFKGEVSEEAPIDPKDAGTNIPKLQSDVKKLTNMIKNKFSMYLSKLDKPIEQAQFLTAMAGEIGVPLSKLSAIIASYKDIAAKGKMDQPEQPNDPNQPSQPKPTQTTGKALNPETKTMTKNDLIESLNPTKRKVIKKVKIKDIK